MSENEAFSWQIGIAISSLFSPRAYQQGLGTRRLPTV
jgi:hypothetical protein